MDNPYLAGPTAHTRDKPQQALLIGMGRVAADYIDFGANFITITIQIDITSARTIPLDGAPCGALGLVADKQHVMPWVMQHGFKIIDDSTTAAHATAGNNDGRTGGGGQMAHRG